VILYKSRDGKSITVVVKDREETMSIEQWSELVARPKERKTVLLAKDAAS
jgi:hypothetical protein